MSGRERHSSSSDDLHAIVEGDLGVPAFFLEPVDEVDARRKLRLDEVRGFVELPVEERNDVVAAAECLAHEPKQRDLALKRLQLSGVVAEFEDPAVAGLRMFSQPGFAESALTQLAAQHPVLAVRNGNAL